MLFRISIFTFSILLFGLATTTACFDIEPPDPLPTATSIARLSTAIPTVDFIEPTVTPTLAPATPTPIPFSPTALPHFSAETQAEVPCTENSIFISPTGHDDTGEGTADYPYYSLEKASAEAHPGTVICVQGGLYFATKDKVVAHGTAAEPIIIQPVPGERVTFDGTDAPLEPIDSIISIHHSSHIIFQGFVVRNSAGRGISFYESEYITIRGNHVYNIFTRAIGGGGAHILIENNEVWNASRENENNAYNAIGGWAAAISNWVRADGSPSEDIVIRRNVVHDVWGEGIMILKSTDFVVEDNTIYNPYSVGIYVNKVENASINGNRIFITDHRFNRSDRTIPAHGILLANENSTEPTPLLKNVVISNNLIVGTGTGIRFWFDPQSQYNNNNYQDLQIVNNTIYATVEEAIYFEEVPLGFNPPLNATIYNNILFAGQNGRVLYLGNRDSWNISHNNWPDGIPPEAQEPHSISVDPMFVEPNLLALPEGFQLQPNSPLIGRGMALDSVTTDFNGNERTNQPTLGIYESATSN